MVYTSFAFTGGCCSKYLNSVWYNTNIVPDCTLVQTARGPTPRNQPATPSVLYIILSPVKTEDVSSVAAPCAFSVVEGDDVEMARFCAGSGLLGLEVGECFEDEVSESEALGAFVEPELVSLC